MSTSATTTMSEDETDVSRLEGDPFAYGGKSVLIWSSLFIVLCTVFVALRFVALRVERRAVGREDWLILPAWGLEIGLCVNAICSVLYGGVGRHEAYLVLYEPYALVAWGQTLFVTELLYGLLFPIVKTAILLLYIRLFHIHTWFRITTKILIAYIWLWAISGISVAFAQCRPLAFAWDKSIHGHCIDQLGYYRWISVPNVIHDVIMLFLPLPVVWTLQIGFRQKLALSAVFFTGFIGCIASFIRLAIFFKLDAFSDGTWTSIQLQPWTLAEPGAILISACLPAIWPLVSRVVLRNSAHGNRRRRRAWASSECIAGKELLESKASTTRDNNGNDNNSSSSSNSSSNNDNNNEAPPWQRNGGRHITDTSNFVPVTDAEDQATTVYSAAPRSRCGNSETAPDDGGHKGINVTTEISWAVTAREPEPGSLDIRKDRYTPRRLA